MLRRLFLQLGWFMPRDDSFETSLNQFATLYNDWVKILATMQVGELSVKENLAWLEVNKAFNHVKTEHKRYVG